MCGARDKPPVTGRRPAPYNERTARCQNRNKGEMNVNVINYRGSDPAPAMRPAFPAKTAPAMAYVPFQSWQNVYTPEVGFGRGTLFADLDKPFIGEDNQKGR